MRMVLPCLGAMLTGALLGGQAQAQAPASLPAQAPAPKPYPQSSTPYPGSYAGAAYPRAAPMPYPPTPYGRGVAPDMCGPGWWGVNRCGAPYGPNHCVYPPFPPYNGERPPIGGGAPAFLPHPFAHGPRDYFMLD